MCYVHVQVFSKIACASSVSEIVKLNSLKPRTKS